MPTKPKDVLSHRIDRDLSEKNAPGLLRFVWYMKYGIVWK